MSRVILTVDLAVFLLSCQAIPIQRIDKNPQHYLIS